jgi:hypothetical protein
MSTITCPSCQTVAPPGAIFCDHCGYDLRTVTPSPAPVPPTYVISSPNTGEIVCQVCQHHNIAGSAFCENCGAQLSASQQATPAAAPSSPAPSPAAPIRPPAGPAPQPVPPVPQTAAAAGSGAPAPVPNVVVGRFVVQDTNVSIALPTGKQVIVIGREDPVSGVFPDVDLDPYGGHEAGVGRRHAQLSMQAGQLYIEDLDSVNGTVVNKQRMSPRRPYPLQSGDELRMGKLVLVYLNR